MNLCDLQLVSINDLTVSGGGGQGFCDDSTTAIVTKAVMMGRRGQELSKIASRHLWTTPKGSCSKKHFLILDFLIL